MTQGTGEVGFQLTALPSPHNFLGGLKLELADSPKVNSMKTIRVLFACGLVLSFCLRLAAQESSLTGTWQFSSSEGTLTLKLNGDGTGSLNNDRFRYLTRGNRLAVEDEAGQTSVYVFNVQGDMLTVSGGNLPGAITFKRQLSSGGGGLLEKKLNQQERAGPRGADEEQSHDGLTGTWQSGNTTVNIAKDGTLTLNGERFNYRVDGKFITLSNGEGSARVEFQLNGNTLITNYEGERTIYRRVTGADRHAAVPRSSSAELAGKWCYMSNVTANDGGRMSNTCFTLYENGTYDFYSETSSSGTYGSSVSQESDSGTWSVSGTTLTANSRARGTLNFTLEKRNHPKTGDPMLVLDGDAFVTYSPRQPWP